MLTLSQGENMVAMGFLIPAAAALILYLVVHEGAHAVAAALLGYPPSRVRIGIGPTLLRIPGRVPVEICCVPVGGAAVFDDRLLDSRSARLALSVAAVAAPAVCLATGAVLASVLPGARDAISTLALAGAWPTDTFARTLAAACAYLGAGNLLPIPPLDGGNAALLLSRASTRAIRTAGAAGLLLLMSAATAAAAVMSGAV